MIDLDQLRATMPNANTADLRRYLAPINAALWSNGIASERRIEFFLANIAHESGDLHYVVENLNYSTVGLVKTFRKYFPTLADATPYARRPEQIANRVYANRMGNGDEASGMGWLHRGSGLIQLTGYHNQKECADHFGIPMNKIGAWLRTPDGAAHSAGWFWKTRGCNELADANDFDGVCDVINIGRKTSREGDANGYADRLENLHDAERAIV